MNYTSSNGPRRFRGMFVLFFFAAAFGLSALVMWLWNAILPQVTGATTITYWQAMDCLYWPEFFSEDFTFANLTVNVHLLPRKTFAKNG
jgi:uncharacterized membrane protein YhdT